MNSYYSKKFRPEAPVVKVNILGEDKKTKREAEFLIDSGADRSCMPSRIFKELRVKEYKLVETYDYRNAFNLEKAYYYRVSLNGSEKISHFLIIPDTYGILGRDIINDYRLSLNGPELKCEIFC